MHTHTCALHLLHQLKFQERERAVQSELDELRASLAQLQQAQTMKKKRAAESKRKMAEISKELSALTTGGAAVESIEQELESLVRREERMCLCVRACMRGECASVCMQVCVRTCVHVGVYAFVHCIQAV